MFPIVFLVNLRPARDAPALTDRELQWSAYAIQLMTAPPMAAKEILARIFGCRPNPLG